MRSISATCTALLLTAALTGCATDSGTDTTSDTGGGSATVAVTGQDAIAWSPGSLSASAGDVTVDLTCEANVNHTFAIEGVDGDIAACDPGGTGSGQVTLEAGSYTFFCSVPGHREAGMEGTLDVS